MSGKNLTQRQRGLALVKSPSTKLAALVDTINREHELVLQSGTAMVEHAIRAGEALLQARETIPDGAWSPWIEENFVGSLSTAHNYMRVALHRDVVGDQTSMRKALTQIAGETGLVKGRRPVYAEEIVEEAKALRAEGAEIREIAREFDVSTDTVLKWTNPEYHERRKRQQRAQAKERRATEAAARAKREQERLKRVARKTGGGIGEAYSLVCRIEDQIARARREATTPEAKQALDAATSHFHRMRDDVVRALGAWE